MTKYTITIRGKWKTWSFPVSGTPEYAAQWRADGLEIDELVHTIPARAVYMGLLRPWCALQTAWRWLLS